MEVLDQYFEYLKRLVRDALDDESLTPRQRLQRYMEIITDKGQSAGEIESNFEATDLAEFLLASWEGAILRMKVERNPAALERFKAIIFETVFKQPQKFAASKRQRRAGKLSTAKSKRHRK